MNKVIDFMSENRSVVLTIIIGCLLVFFFGYIISKWFKNNSIENVKDEIIGTYKEIFNFKERKILIFPLAVSLILPFIINRPLLITYFKVKELSGEKLFWATTGSMVLILITLITVEALFLRLVKAFNGLDENTENYLIIALGFNILFCLILGAIKKEMVICIVLMYIGAISNYVLTMTIMVKGVINPFSLAIVSKNIPNKEKGDNSEQLDKKESEDAVLKLPFFNYAMIIVLIILDLFVLVHLTNIFTSEAYSIANKTVTLSYWQSFYYTVISFTTIGYGDIASTNFCSQLLSIFIAISSVICLIIFIGSFWSAKEYKSTIKK